MATEEWIYRFGDVEVEPAAHRITRAGADLAVEPKAFAVLAALLEQAGKALERDDLLDRVWGHRHVTPGVLNRVVAQLRKALGDDAEHPRYIQTLHSLGYRFIADVQRVSASLPQPSLGVGEAAPAALAESEATVPPLVGSKRRKWLLPAAVVALAVAAAFAWFRPERSQVRPAASIAILPFTSLSSSKDDRYFAEGLAVEMHDALAGVKGLKVAARMSPATTIRGEDAKAIGERLGVASVLDASIRREGSRIRINASLSDTATGYTLWSHTYDRRMSDVFATQSDIASEVVHSLMGVLPGRSEALARRLTPTRNTIAYEAYLNGLRLLQPSSGNGDADSAIGFFSQALAADGGFARAQAGICRSELRRFEGLRNADAYQRAQTACAKAVKMDPSLAEVTLAFGDLHRLRGEPGKAIEYYAKLQAHPALAADAYVGIAKVHAAQGRQALALQAFERAQALRPNDASIVGELGYQQYLAGHVDEAIASYRKAANLRPNDEDLWSSLGGLYLTAGKQAEAAEAFERSIRIKPTDAVLSNYGAMKYQAGDYSAAAALFRRATALDTGDFLIWGYLGDALLAGSAPTAQVRAPFQRAADMAGRYVELKPDDAKALAALGWYHANLGDASRARQLVARSEALGTERGEVALYNAQTLTTLGDMAGARARVATARAAGIAADRIETDTFLPPASKGR